MHSRALARRHRAQRVWSSTLAHHLVHSGTNSQRNAAPQAALAGPCPRDVPRRRPRRLSPRPIGATVARQMPVLKVTRSNRVSVTSSTQVGRHQRYTHRRASARSRRRSSAPSWRRTTASSEAVSHGNPTTRICTYPLVTTKSLVPTSLPLARKTRRKRPALYIDNPIGS